MKFCSRVMNNQVEIIIVLLYSLLILVVTSSAFIIPSSSTTSSSSSLSSSITTIPKLKTILSPIRRTTETTAAALITSNSRTAGRDSKLYSLNKLVDDIRSYHESSSSSNNDDPKTIFVGGKGGVGKTTISSSLAVSLASSYEDDLRVLIVSTDPAHSLGDALDVDLRSNTGKPIIMTDPLTSGKLHACEVDTTSAINEFKSNLDAFDINKLSNALGVSIELLEGLGLREFSSLLNNPPPGLDELVALSNVLDNKELSSNYDVVIVDTAPTGHTLRLLALPQFLDGLLGKLIELRMKLSGLVSTLQSFFGNPEEARQRTETIDNAMNKLESFRIKMSSLKRRLKDSKSTSFVVVSIPTKLSIEESKRLINELNKQNVKVSDIVINQCVGSGDGDGDGDGGSSHDAILNYYERRRSGQQKWINQLQESINDVSSSNEYKSNGDGNVDISLTTIPLVDVELVGIPALAYLGNQVFTNNPNYDYLLNGGNNNDDDDNNTKMIICGGKGGVGKTTTSSSLAVSMAAAGHNVALISTDPAHSLGDAIDMNLNGGKLIDCPLIGVPNTGGEVGSLSVLEIDPTEALGQFKGIVDQLIGSGSDGNNAASGDNNNSGLQNTLKELGEIFDTLPAGTDEVVALAKVVSLIKKGEYDRIVLDTAPTGHTLRMLSTPSFLAELIDRVLIIANKVNSNAAVKMLITSAASNSGKSNEDVETAAQAAKSALLSFQLQMYDLEDLFADPETTEFCIVTVATELAVRESVRLLNALTYESPDMPIKVRNVIVNQVLNNDGSDIETFIKQLSSGQESAIRNIQSTIQQSSTNTNNNQQPAPIITTVPYLDTEPRGVFGLKALSSELFDD